MSGDGTSQGVNNILHKLRGEQFRQLQNIKHSTSHLSTARNFSAPTLPPATADYEQSPVPASTSSRLANPVSWSGPAPPKSWRSSPQTRDRNTPQWRAEALGIVALRLGNFFPVSNSVPSLSLLCLQLILSTCGNSNEFREQIAPFIPNHLRRDLIRHCAIHSPLSSEKLDTLLEPDGHIDGEIMIVGRSASLQRDHLQRIANVSLHNHSADWEVDDQAFRPLHTLVFLTSSIANSILLAIPPTLTILVLIDVSPPQPLHRLPKLCPLLVLLDLSYNSWLRDPSVEGYGSFEKIDWSRWGHLEILGLRECYATQEQVHSIEKGKWGGLSIMR